jgi:hypothetical protein
MKVEFEASGLREDSRPDRERESIDFCLGAGRPFE